MVIGHDAVIFGMLNLMLVLVVAQSRREEVSHDCGEAISECDLALSMRPPALVAAPQCMALRRRMRDRSARREGSQAASEAYIVLSEQVSCV